MIGLLQRVSRADVVVDGETIGEIDHGLMVLVAVHRDDTDKDVERLAERLLGYRVFPDDEGRMNRAVQDFAGSALIVSQFTLAAETRGNRPGFSTAAAPEDGERLYEHFKAQVREHGVAVSSGNFGAEMKVSLVNDGPVTIWIDTDQR